MSRILILTDYRSQFYSSTKHRGASLDVHQIVRIFESQGYIVEVAGFSCVKTADYYGVHVLYQSSEDNLLHYNQYIEDVLLGLQLRGAILIPRFELFRAHHNKVFMEILRNSLKVDDSLFSRTYGTFEEYVQDASSFEYPIVIKSVEGSRGRNVFIARNKQEADKIARKVSSTPSMFNMVMACRNFIDGKGYTSVSNHRKRFIVQRFVPRFSGDFKVLVYGDNYFVVFRENRPNDFRASGSGRLSFPESVPKEVLDEAKRVYLMFDVPYASFDIGFDGVRTYLLEFQFVQFGQYAVEKSTHRFQHSCKEWQLVRGTTTAEKELATSVHSFIQNGSVL